jgi:hypothetical protein
MPAGATYNCIATTTLSSAQSSVTFSSISGSYTDLVCVINSNTTADTQIRIRFNSDSGNNYSATIIYGDGTSAGSVRVSNESSGNIGGLGTNWGTTVIHLNNYSNATTYKTILGRYNETSASYGEAGAKVVLWRSTSAITSIAFTLPSTYTYASGSTFSLYGIQAA